RMTHECKCSVGPRCCISLFFTILLTQTVCSSKTMTLYAFTRFFEAGVADYGSSLAAGTGVDPRGAGSVGGSASGIHVGADDDLSAGGEGCGAAGAEDRKRSHF